MSKRRESSEKAPSTIETSFMGRKWDESEDSVLRELVQKHGKQWALIASHLVQRTPSQVAARWEKCLDPVITKGPFTAEEDKVIKDFVSQNGPKSWPRITEMLPNRSSKQCRERWFNHLDPSVSKAQWTYEEDLTIFSEHMKIGAKWSQIAKLLPGRTDNAVKNRWNSSISKRIELATDGTKQLIPDASRKAYKHQQKINTPPADAIFPKPPVAFENIKLELPKPPNNEFGNANINIDTPLTPITSPIFSSGYLSAKGVLEALLPPRCSMPPFTLRSPSSFEKI